MAGPLQPPPPGPSPRRPRPCRCLGLLLLLPPLLLLPLFPRSRGEPADRVGWGCARRRPEPEAGLSCGRRRFALVGGLWGASPAARAQVGGWGCAAPRAEQTSRASSSSHAGSATPLWTTARTRCLAGARGEEGSRAPGVWIISARALPPDPPSPAGGGERPGCCRGTHWECLVRFASRGAHQEQPGTFSRRRQPSSGREAIGPDNGVRSEPSAAAPSRSSPRASSLAAAAPWRFPVNCTHPQLLAVCECRGARARSRTGSAESRMQLASFARLRAHLPLCGCFTLFTCLQLCVGQPRHSGASRRCAGECRGAGQEQCCLQTWGENGWREADSAPPAAWTAPRVEVGTRRDSERRNPDSCLFVLPSDSPKGCLQTLCFGVDFRRPSTPEFVSYLPLKPTRSTMQNVRTHSSCAKKRRRREGKFLPLVRTRRAANRHPLFPQYNYQVQVAENQPPGTPVITMAAQDPDSGEAGRLFYSMDALMNSRSLELFSIDSQNGLITTTEILDRENMDLHYFRVTAADHGVPRLSATTMVAVTVADRNDHNPVFEQSEYRETIRENVEEGYPILQLRATDVDSPSNANIRYRFVNEQAAHSVFEIDSRSGLITTSGQVDREKMEKYSLVVEANDQGKEPSPRSATVRVYITVLDENDNVPQFSEKRYIVQVREDIRPHSEILRVTATDLDKDNNALVHYNIISGNSRGQFSIDSVTGEIQVVAPLDFEVEREYALRIRAQDAGRPPLSNNTGMVSVQVVDINDHAPIFVSTPFQISVLENAPFGHSVIHIQAVDADYGENARLEYKLTGVSSDTPFVVNSATGWITVSGSLDRETVEHYFFGVEARDHGSPSLSASASVTITVMDVNDNRPEFTQKEYFIRLNEDAAVGTSVLSVTAIDKDVNSAISYQITGGNTRNRFAISTQGGVGLITLSLPLDYKQERRYVLTVTASDRTLHDNCHVHINITDANTHRPVFQSAHYSVNVNEDRPVGSTVVVISATDDDVGENARITYYLEDNIPQFRIDADTGAITLQAELDYEDQVTYTLAITAKDNGIPQKADTTYVEIMVNDVNDNAPQFVSSHYQGIISEDSPPFTSVLQISATDRDAHANGRVQYTFQNGEDGDGDFTIEPTSGIIRTVRRLDRESNPVYMLTAYAVDRGVPPQRTPVHIQVTVQDVNDNAPVFPAEDFEVLVKENSIVGSVVAQITAIDPDEGPNAQIMYQIVEGNIPEIFQMDIFSGELTALIDLDYETKSEYVIVVQATSAPLVSRATVHIKLIDQNDNSPILKNFQILFNNYVSNKSNTFPSGVIGKIPAYDPDVSDRLFYTFERGNELHLLIVNQTSGELRLSRKLDNNRPLVASMLVTVTGKSRFSSFPDCGNVLCPGVTAVGPAC